MTYEFIEDAGHGWLKVPLNECKGLDISRYSYMDSNFAYLEEDCDFSRFADSKGWNSWADIEPHIRKVNHGNRSRIRDLDSYIA